MSASEILEQLPKLSCDERMAIYRRILEIEKASNLQETAEIYDAIDAGLHSLNTEPLYTPEQARARIAQWTTES